MKRSDHGHSRVRIRPLALSDRREFLAAVSGSRSLHRPWARPPSSAAGFRAYFRRTQRPENRAFVIRRRDTDAMVGVINISNIVLGLFRSGYLGYYAFAGHERRGLMREGLAQVIRLAFHSLRLHRLEANVQPGNAASLALVKACGFSREGYSPRYLKIGGRWKDHERWAIVAS